MKVVVTGGSGRVGTYVVQALLASPGHDITVFDQLPPRDAPGARWMRGDIENLGDVVGILAGADAVVHLAAIPQPGLTPDQVLFRTNVLGTYNVHEAAYRLGIRRVVSTSSAAILGWTYGEREILPEYFPIDETHPVAPHDPYGLAKRCEEEIARSYTRKCDMETVVLRLARVLFPEAVDELRQQGGMRPRKFNLCAYVHVEDAARGYRQAVEAPIQGHETLFLVADDSSAGAPLCDVLPRLIPGLGDRASGLGGTAASISNRRARAVLGWAPTRSWRGVGG